MSLQKIGKQLRREFKTNPKKAVTLGILFLVAAWFWAPLIFKSKGPETLKAPAAAATTQVAQVAGAPAETPNRAVPQYRWQDLDREMKSDPRMDHNLEDLVERLGRNPFVGRTIVIAAVEKKPEPKNEEIEEKGPSIVTPEDVGLTLSGTVIGRRRTALISGKVYAEGREVASKEGHVFVVRTIEARRIVLEREGQEFELVMVRKRTTEPVTETSETNRAPTANLENVVDALLKQADR